MKFWKIQILAIHAPCTADDQTGPEILTHPHKDICSKEIDSFPTYSNPVMNTTLIAYTTTRPPTQRRHKLQPFNQLKVTGSTTSMGKQCVLRSQEDVCISVVSDFRRQEHASVSHSLGGLCLHEALNFLLSL